MVELISESDLLSFLHSEEFEDLLRYPEKAKHENIYVTGLRHEEKRELFYLDGINSFGGIKSPEYFGDIILKMPVEFGDGSKFENNFNLIIGSRFDWSNGLAVGSHLRILDTYLRMNAWNQIRQDERAFMKDGCLGMPFNGARGMYPCIQIYAVGDVDQVAGKIEKHYLTGKKYLELIDSDNFGELRKHVSEYIESNINILASKEHSPL